MNFRFSRRRDGENEKGHERCRDGDPFHAKILPGHIDTSS